MDASLRVAARPEQLRHVLHVGLQLRALEPRLADARVLAEQARPAVAELIAQLDLADREPTRVADHALVDGERVRTPEVDRDLELRLADAERGLDDNLRVVVALVEQKLLQGARLGAVHALALERSPRQVRADAHGHAPLHLVLEQRREQRLLHVELDRAHAGQGHDVDHGVGAAGGVARSDAHEVIAKRGGPLRDVVSARRGQGVVALDGRREQGAHRGRRLPREERARELEFDPGERRRTRCDRRGGHAARGGGVVTDDRDGRVTWLRCRRRRRRWRQRRARGAATPARGGRTPRSIEPVERDRRIGRDTHLRGRRAPGTRDRRPACDEAAEHDTEEDPQRHPHGTKNFQVRFTLAVASRISCSAGSLKFLPRYPAWTRTRRGVSSSMRAFTVLP